MPTVDEHEVGTFIGSTMFYCRACRIRCVFEVFTNPGPTYPRVLLSERKIRAYCELCHTRRMDFVARVAGAKILHEKFGL